MFRSESSRERALLRLIESQQRIITEQANQIMYLAGRAWSLPDHDLEPDAVDPQDTYVSSLDEYPDEYAAAA